jgi:hypothetical protein
MRAGKSMNATTSRVGKYLMAAVQISIAVAFFYGMIWVIWDL